MNEHELARRIARLERTNRVLVVFALSVVALMLMGQAAPRTVRAEAFELSRPDGTTAGFWAMRNGLVVFNMHGPKDADGVHLMAFDGGSAVTVEHTGGGKAQLAAVTATSSVKLAFADQDEKDKSEMSYTLTRTSPGPTAQWLDHAGRPVWKFPTDAAK